MHPHVPTNDTRTHDVIDGLNAIPGQTLRGIRRGLGITPNRVTKLRTDNCPLSELTLDLVVTPVATAATAA